MLLSGRLHATACTEVLCGALCYKADHSEQALLLPIIVLRTWQQQKAVHHKLQTCVLPTVFAD